MRTTLIALTLLMAGVLNAADSASFLVYFGTYTRGSSKGVYVGRFDSAAGRLEGVRLAGEVPNPSWVTIHPNGRNLYAVTEAGNDGKTEGAITAFSLDPVKGDLTKLNAVSSGGGGACHLAVDKTGKTIAVANYGSGSVASFRLEADGRLGSRASLHQHSGSSVNERRQTGPHAHAVVFSPDNRFLFVPDLGLDRVLIYRLNPGQGTLTPAEPSSARISPGLGPRHFAFDAKGRFAYVLNEMGSSVTTFAWDSSRGLREIQTVATLGQDFAGENNSAEIEVDRRGRFVYASNRGHDSITVFAVDRQSGALSVVERVSTQGKTPRGFKLDPTGRFLLAANQNSSNVVVFKVDSGTGKLSPAGQVVDVPFPVCVQFLAP